MYHKKDGTPILCASKQMVIAFYRKFMTSLEIKLWGISLSSYVSIFKSPDLFNLKCDHSVLSFLLHMFWTSWLALCILKYIHKIMCYMGYNWNLRFISKIKSRIPNAVQLYWKEIVRFELSLEFDILLLFT